MPEGPNLIGMRMQHQFADESGKPLPNSKTCRILINVGRQESCPIIR